jgi:uncharacterized damage-inducible protein DinB
MTIERSLPSGAADERAMLTGFLDFHRATLATKCEGLTDAQLRQQAVPPSALSLLGLVRHMAEMEGQFRMVFTGEPMRGIWAPGPDLDVDAAFREVGTASAADAFAAWQAECENSRKLTDAAVSLDVGAEFFGETWTLRWVLCHMIEEYARHNGHADLLQERIDGRTGQ